MIPNTTTSWGSVSRILHWTLGFAVVAMLAYGWWMNHMVPDRAARLFHRSIHADIGYVVLLLMIGRLIWRSRYPVPAPPPDAPTWERIAARVSHISLYAITILVGFFGWAHSGAHTPDYADWFGLFRVPQFTSPNKASADFYENLHIYLAYVLMALVTIHILAAIYHVVAKDDDVMARMTRGEGT